MSYELDPVHYYLIEAEIQEILALQPEPPSISTSASGSVYPQQERKLKRMLSNRESARRSRLKKKRHLDELTEQANQLKVENRQLKRRLTSLISHCHSFIAENNQLRSESIHLQLMLSGLCQLLVNHIQF